MSEAEDRSQGASETVLASRLELDEPVEEVEGELVELTGDQAEHLAALERIDRAGVEWRDALQAAIDCGCAEEAIRNRVVLLVSDVFGVNMAAIAAMNGMV